MKSSKEDYEMLGDIYGLNKNESLAIKITFILMIVLVFALISLAVYAEHAKGKFCESKGMEYTYDNECYKIDSGKMIIKDFRVVNWKYYFVDNGVEE